MSNPHRPLARPGGLCLGIPAMRAAAQSEDRVGCASGTMIPSSGPQRLLWTRSVRRQVMNEYVIRFTGERAAERISADACAHELFDLVFLVGGEERVAWPS